MSDLSAMRERRAAIRKELQTLDAEIKRLEGEALGIAVGQIVRDKKGRLGQVRKFETWSSGKAWVDVWLVNKDGKVGNRPTFFGTDWEPVSGTDMSPPLGSISVSEVPTAQQDIEFADFLKSTGAP